MRPATAPNGIRSTVMVCSRVYTRACVSEGVSEGACLGVCSRGGVCEGACARELLCFFWIMHGS